MASRESGGAAGAARGAKAPGGEGRRDLTVGHGAHRLSLVVNALLATMKLVAGFLLVSPALVADGWHSLADTVSSAVGWLGFHWASEPADEDHHYGHGNLEAFAGLVIGLVLVVGGVVVVVRALRGEAEAIPEGRATIAMAVALVSALVNFGLASVTGRAARHVGSLSLTALTWDNLGDGLSSLVVLAAIGARGAGYPFVEFFVAGAIGVLIAAMGQRSVRSGFDVLMDRVSDPSLRFGVAATARDVPGVRGVQNVRIHPLGSDVRIDMEINVDGHLTVAEGHDIAHAVEDAVQAAHHQVQGVHVHMNPCEGAGHLGEALLGSPLLAGTALEAAPAPLEVPAARAAVPTTTRP